MVTDIVMPRYSITMEKGTAVKWLRKEGEAVEKGDPLVEVEADKATVVCEALADGILAETAIVEGTVATGQVVGYLDA